VVAFLTMMQPAQCVLGFLHESSDEPLLSMCRGGQQIQVEDIMVASQW